jgi:hypothetical protein
MIFYQYGEQYVPARAVVTFTARHLGIGSEPQPRMDGFATQTRRRARLSRLTIHIGNKVTKF